MSDKQNNASQTSMELRTTMYDTINLECLHCIKKLGVENISNWDIAEVYVTKYYHVNSAAVKECNGKILVCI